jgi:predicted metal-dependent hydrolase
LYPSEYIQFLAHFHGDRDYFECHELLEDYWKKIDSRNKNSIWVGLILLAVSTYHHRRNNFGGAKRTLAKAVKIFIHQADILPKLGLDKIQLVPLLKERLSAIQKDEAYKSFSLPICDPILLTLSKKACQTMGFLWENESDLTNIALVHRHKLRDRSKIIKERVQLIKIRKGNE